MTIHLEVAVAAPLFHSLSYACRPDQDPPPVGVRLLVPLGRQRVTGYVLSHQPTQASTYTIRPFLRRLDDTPLFPENMVSFLRWVADYYHYPLGEVIKLALPGGLTVRSSKHLVLTAAGANELPKLKTDPNLIDQSWLTTLAEKGLLSPTKSRALNKSPDKTLLKKWCKAGFMQQKEQLSTPTTKIKKEWCIQRCLSPLPATLKPSEEKTLAILTDLTTPNSPSIPRRDLTRQYRGAGPAIRSLTAQGIIALHQEVIHRDPFGERPPFFAEPDSLTSEQQQALAQIKPAINHQQFQTFLLHGVTGSGKTEVFLQAAAHTMAQQRDVLVLVPEIALSTQLEGHFFSRFGKTVALLHSGLSAGERYDQWRRILRGEAHIVIGARSAIFAPLLKPGLIIVDEEHDGAYKQDDTLRYNARDLAVLRGSLQQSVVILASATPAITSYYNGTQGKFTTLTMAKRVADRALPSVEIIDLKGVKTVSGRPPLFSPQLTKALKENLAHGNQSLIFLNRRGFANLMLCADCGTTIKCPHCAITLTLHKGQNKLLCHYCGHQGHSKPLCPTCHSPRIKEMGFGTERLEEELATIMPAARIARLDHDTSRSRQNFLTILKKVHKREIDILVGTQMITKGHHFPHVTLVGLVWADAGLSIPDYKAAERTFQLISQVTGRAGRGDKSGHVIIQTYQPDHYAVQAAKRHDYQGLYAQEIALRQTLRYPPFSRLINLKFSGPDEKTTAQAAQQCGEQAKAATPGQIEILGPAAAPLSRLRERFRFQLLLKGWHLPGLKELARQLRDNPPPAVRQGKVRMTLDVDPETML